MDKIYVYDGPIKHICGDCGKLIREEPYAHWEGTSPLHPDTDGYLHLMEWCPDCQQKHAVKKVRKFGSFVKLLLIILLIGGVVYGGGYLFNNIVLGTGTMSEKSFEKRLQEYESNDAIMKDLPLKEAPGVASIRNFREDLDEQDYHMYLYESGKAEVQKRTVGEKVYYFFKFDKDWGDLSQKTFTLDGDTIFEKGEKKLFYTAASSQYQSLMKKLKAYLPENYCGKGSYTSESLLYVSEEDTYIMANIIYGKDTTILWDKGEDEYFEKQADAFVRITLAKAGEGRFLFSYPERAEYTEAT